ncbi:hypothetical protein LTR62_001947 [Meristemomyces frigidus]|uniref:Uncharacterized protein n=1 Tax=Meristemomyces frigidus TaxID=1508187 RepID=A0AAN7T8T6_9PEZI|nr:hypothetical protein LTR62_001947 [Meristemomyces frigidus]
MKEAFAADREKIKLDTQNIAPVAKNNADVKPKEAEPCPNATQAHEEEWTFVNETEAAQDAECVAMWRMEQAR